MADGEIVYEVRADDSNLESDLKKGQKKIEKSLKETEKESERIEKNTGEVKKQVQADVTKSSIEENKKQVQDDDEAGQKREGFFKRHSESIKGMASGAAKHIGTAMSVIGSGIVDIGKSAINSAVSMDKAMNQFAASTGVGKEETERYQNILEDIYKNNYGENFEEIGQAMASVKERLGDMSDASLQEVTESAFALRDTFGYEIPESTQAAKAMMDNFGTSGEEAMALLAAGAQNGLDSSGQLVDSISKYSEQFAKVGLNADDMFKIFQTGADTGAFSFDQIGTAVGEMAARVLDGSDATNQGFEAIGLNADEMAGKFAAGGDSAKEAFKQTIDALAGMEDPMAQNAAGVSLFGSAWEDLGPEVVEQLAGIQDGAYDTADAMNGIKEVKYDDLGSMFEGLQRAVEMLILPLGEQLVPLLSDLIESVLPMIEEALPPLIDFISQALEQTLPFVEQILPMLLEAMSGLVPVMLQIGEQVLPILLDMFSQVIPLLGSLVEAVLPILAELFSALIPPIVEIISAVLPVLIELVDALLPIFEMLIGLLMPVIDLFMQLLEPILALISSALVPLLDALMPIINVICDLLIPVLNGLISVFSAVFSEIVNALSGTVRLIVDIFNGIVDFVKNLFTVNWKSVWQNVVDIFEKLITGISNIFKKPINFVIDGINGFIKGINKIEVPDWVPVVGGKGFHISTIPRLRVGMEYVPSDDFPALLHKGEAVLTAQENALYQSVGGFEGIMCALSAPQNRDTYVTVKNEARQPEIDYGKIANATVNALTRAGVKMELDRREIGRIIREEQR